MPEYTPEQLWPLYEKLPKDLQEAIFSGKTADAIHDVCAGNGLEEEKISEVAKYTGYVMLGLLPPDEFQKTLKEELGLENDLAKKVTLEITHFVFYPVKESLALLYKTEVAPPKPEAPLITRAEAEGEEGLPSLTRPEVAPSPEIERPVKEKPEKMKRDIYREPIE